MAKRARSQKKPGQDNAGQESNVGQIEQAAPAISLPPGVTAPQVRIHAPALNQVWQHTRSAAGVEVGGLLVGSVALHGEQEFVVDILGSIAATLAQSSPTSLTFTVEAWDRLKTERQDRYPNLQQVGWYHSHPGFGAFFSTIDLTLHRQEFGRQVWYIALVIDPQRGQFAVFWPHAEGTALCPVAVLGA